MAGAKCGWSSGAKLQAQIPNPKIQIPKSKSQNPNPKEIPRPKFQRASSQALLRFGFWDFFGFGFWSLGFRWSLVFGAWSFRVDSPAQFGMLEAGITDQWTR